MPGKSPQDIYARHLLSHRGYPLWTPEPSQQLLAYRRDGLRIGDVGVVIPEDGCFDVYFNVCLPQDHPFHQAIGVPDNFKHIELSDVDIRTIINAENNGCVIATSSAKTIRTIERSGDSSSRTQSSGLEYEFTLSSSEGALLILPEGAERHDLRNHSRFLEAATQHGADWYRFAEEKVGQIIGNDSLYLITGLYKSRSWSLAAFEKTAESGEYPARFRISETGGDNIAAAGTWNTTRSLEWHVGPIDNYGIPNQSVFVRGFKIALCTSMFRNKWISVKADAPSARLNPVKSSGAIPRASWLRSLLGGLPFSRAGESSRSGTRVKKAADPAMDASRNEIQSNRVLAVGEHVVIQRIPEASQAFHPSDVINRYLLNKDPFANIAITHDDEWIALLEKNLLQPENIVQDGLLEMLVSQNYYITSNAGAAYLRSRDSVPDTFNSNKVDATAADTENPTITVVDAIPPTEEGDVTTPQVPQDTSQVNPMWVQEHHETSREQRMIYERNSTSRDQITQSTSSIPWVQPGSYRINDTHPEVYTSTSSEDNSSMGPSLYSLIASFHSSNTSWHSQVHLQPCTEESEGFDHLMNELPFKDLTATVKRKRGFATRLGSFGDIWECDLISGGSSHRVAVKALKTGYRDLRSHEKKLRRELKVWGRLQHRNIVLLLGIVSDFGPLPSMVSPWFSQGSLSSYLGHLVRHHVSMSKMQKHALLGDIAAGLCYLHSQDVIHGDLHSENVLIDDDGRACLTDFGLSIIVNEFAGTSYLKSSICGGVQFADPALVRRVNSEQGRVVYPTKPCDIYSFGGLMLHVLSGKRPFDGLAPPAILLKVLEGKRPEISTNDKHITAGHKVLIQRCWDHEELKRPSADDLAKLLADTSNADTVDAAAADTESPTMIAVDAIPSTEQGNVTTLSASQDTSRVNPMLTQENKRIVESNIDIPRISTTVVPDSERGTRRCSSCYTAESPGEPVPPSPVVEPSTPSSATAPINMPSIIDSCIEGSEDGMISELPFNHLAATVRRRKSYASRQGAFGDIWECDLISEGSSRMVAVKAVKIGSYHGDLKSHEKTLHRELKVWGRLQHRNIVPLLGIVPGFGPLPSMVSPWFPNGSLSLYIAHHQMSMLKKHRLLGDIAAGLCYLHSQDVIHGDLESENVLIDDDGRACLTDFGLSIIINEFVGTSYLRSSICGSVLFADPALVRQVNSEQGRVVYPTKPCDIYSFGGLMLHVLSGKRPFDGLSSPSAFVKVLNGGRPQIPASNKHVIAGYKTLIQRCWDREESRRPSADDLAKMFA